MSRHFAPATGLAERRSETSLATVGICTVLWAAILGLAVTPVAAQEGDQEAVPATSSEVVTEAADKDGGGVGQAPEYHQLVPVAIARTAEVEVVVAGTVDHSSVRSIEADGGSGYSFSLVDASGEALEVVTRGKLPVGFSVAEIVVVEGSGHGGRLVATEVLVPGANRGLIAVMSVTLVGWLGLFVYVFRLSRKLRRLEEE